MSVSGDLWYGQIDGIHGRIQIKFIMVLYSGSSNGQIQLIHGCFFTCRARKRNCSAGMQAMCLFRKFDTAGSRNRITTGQRPVNAFSVQAGRMIIAQRNICAKSLAGAPEHRVITPRIVYRSHIFAGRKVNRAAFFFCIVSGISV